MSLALFLVIAGLVICFGAFIFAAANILRTPSQDLFSRSDSLFKKHLGAMIALAFGGLVMAIGFILGGMNILDRIFHIQ